MGDEKHRLKNQLAERACRPAAESMAQHWPDLGSGAWTLAIHCMRLANPVRRFHQSTAGFSPPRNKPVDAAVEFLRLRARRHAAAKPEKFVGRRGSRLRASSARLTS
jgi:hypothetical protein